MSRTLPSPIAWNRRDQPRTGEAVVRIRPFRGVRYDTDVVGDLADVTAPPYDAIDTGTQQALYEASPHNVIRLELARSADAGPGYAGTRSCYLAWLRDGVLVHDDVPALHPYVQTWDGGEQRGVLAAVEVAPWSEAVIPHERIYAGPTADRRALLEALEVNVSPVFTLAENAGDATRALLDAATEPPFVDTTDATGIRHRVWRVTDEAAIADYAAALAPQRLLMADGHHRYTAAQEASAAGVPGSDDILAFVVPVSDGAAIRPMHRLLHDPRTPDSADGWRAAVSDLPVRLDPVVADVGDVDADQLTRTLDQRPDVLGIVLTDEDAFALVVTDSAALREALFATATNHGRLAREETRGPLAATETALVQSFIHEGLGLGEGLERVEHTPDLPGAIGRVHAGAARALVVTRAVALAEVAAVATGGQRLPQKTTSFHPKPRTGLVLRPLR